jgi:hypothetical protein
MNIGITTTNSQANFISKYGSYAAPYTALDGLGHPRNKYYPLVSVGAFVFMFVMLILTKEKLDPMTNKPLPETTIDTILKYIKYFSFALFLGSLGFNGYMYFLVYLPQYTKWIQALPDAARTELLAINTLNAVMSNVSQAANAYSGPGINIRL